MIYKHNPALTEHAKRLRKNMTKEEKHLWYDYLKGHPERFQKQKILGRYIADFYCAKAGLVIEIDGEQHYEDDAIAYDKRRTEFLNKYGLEVIRILNSEINNNFFDVCEYIDEVVKKRIHREI
ncbi:MAG: endonuclease domain-containing protein [Ruminococcaceae bacterium]|nr:endonuclease domain-containing protein [Oscillospiraceae bacterium]